MDLLVKKFNDTGLEMTKTCIIWLAMSLRLRIISFHVNQVYLKLPSEHNVKVNMKW